MNKIFFALKNFFRSQRGFTLVEMLLYMGIFSILMIVLMQIFISAIDTQLTSKATSSVDQDGAYILSRLSYDISRAQAVIAPSSYGSGSNNLTIQIGGSDYTYSLDSNDNLIVTNTYGTNQLNSVDTTLNNLTFTRIGNPAGKDTIQMSFQLKSTTQRNTGYELRNFTTTVSLR